MRNTLYKFLLICFLISSCSSVEREQYRVINDFLKEKDSVLIINVPIPYSEFSYFSFDFNTKKEKQAQSIFPIGWKDTFNKIDLDQKDIYQLREQMKNIKISLWEQKKIYSVKNIIVPKDSIYSKNLVNFPQYNSYKLKRNLTVFRLSKPGFNKSRDIAVFGFNVLDNTSISRLSNDFSIIIMKKENGKWVFIGKEVDSFQN
jgi:hypothetical protein